MADEKKEQKLSVGTLDDYNKAVLDKVNRDLTKANEGFIASVVAAKKKSPHISPHLFDDMIEASNNLLPDFIKQTAEAQKAIEVNGKTATAATLNDTFINNEIYKAQIEFQDKIRDEAKRKNTNRGIDKVVQDAQVDEAFKLTQNELPKKGILGSIASSFYDGEKGVQWGGIGGAIVGLFLGSSLFGGMEGGLMGIVAMIALAVAGAFAGNMVSEKFFPAKTPEKTTDLSQGKGLSQGQTVGQGKSVAAGATVDTAKGNVPAEAAVEEQNDQLVFLGAKGMPLKGQTFYVDKDGKMLSKSDASSGLIKVTVDGKGSVTSFDVADEKGVFKFKDQDIPISLPDGKGVFKVESKTFEPKKGVDVSYIDLSTPDSRSQLDSVRDAWNKKIEEFDKALLKGASREKGSEQGADKLSFNRILEHSDGVLGAITPTAAIIPTPVVAGEIKER